MTARTGMATLIEKLRAMTNTAADDYTIANVSYWSDDQVQDALDRYRQDIYRAQLQSIQTYDENGDVEYKIYHADYGDLESGTNFEIETSTGETVNSETYTVDYTRGVITFDADTTGLTYYINAHTYDLYAAASYIWRLKAAHVASAYDFRTTTQTMNRSQMMKQFLEMANQYASLSGPVVTTVFRSDTSC